MMLEELQFGAMMVVAMLTLTLVTQVPRQVGRTVGRARWLMVGMMALLFVQFLLQYLYGFRATSVTLGVAVNLLFFIPASCLMNVAVLYLQHHGTVFRSAWLAGGLCWGVTVLLLSVTGGSVFYAFLQGQPLPADLTALQVAEYIAALSFAATQLWFYNLLYKEHKKLKAALDNYNDDDTEGLLEWMHNSVLMLSAAAVLVPLAIFLSGPTLLVFSVLFFSAIYYCIIRFYRYAVSTTPEMVEEAQVDYHAPASVELSGVTGDESCSEEAKTTKTEVNEDVIRHVGEVVAQWTEQKGYRRKKATLQRVADEMGIPRNQLSAWLRARNKVFNSWINGLRIEEAKQMLKDHAEWSNDSVADACGFGSRSYFQTVFKDNTGMTPAQYLSQEQTN